MTKKYEPKNQYKLQSDLPQSGGKLDAEFSAVSDSTDKIAKWIDRGDLDAETGRLKAGKVNHHNLSSDLTQYLLDTANGSSEQNRADAQSASVSASLSATKSENAALRSEAAYQQVAGEAGRASEFADEAGASQLSSEVAKNASVAFADKSSNSANHAEEDANRASMHEETSANWAEYLAGPVPLTNASYLPNETPESVRHGYFSARWWAHEAERRVTLGLGSGSGAGMIISATEPKDVVTGTQWLDSTTARVWIWDEGKWLEFPSGGGSGGVVVSESEPLDPFEGMLWMDSTTAQIWIRDAGKWLEFPAGGSGGGMIISADQPNYAEAGTQWLDTTTGKVWIWDGLRWLEFPANSAGGSGGMVITDDEPVDAAHGTQWLESGTGRVWIRDTDKWLEFPASCFPESVSGGGGSGAGMVISETEPAVRETGMQWLESGTSIVWIWDSDKWLEFPVSASYGDDGGFVGTITTQQVLTVPDVMFRDAQGRFKSTKNVPELANQMEVNRWVFDQLDGGAGGIEEAPSDGKSYTRKDAGWSEANYVDSVNGQVGVVTLTYTDVGAAPTGDYATNAGIATSVKSKRFVETVREPRYQGGTATLELDLANNFTMDFSGATSYMLGLSGAPSAAGDAYGFTLTLDTTNMDALVWDDKIKWSTGTAPTLTAGVTYVFTFLSTDGGTTFKGFLGGESFA